MSEDQILSKNDKIVENLAFAAIKEQRIKRRWRTFFIILTFIYLTPMFLVTLNVDSKLFNSSSDEESGYVAKVELSGMIISGGEGNANNIIKGLKKAFEDEKTVGVILEVNSPGGSPVQSAYIYDEIRLLRKKHEDIPLYAVVEDVAASGGYFVAAAADKIFVNKSSMVGSIGVRMDNFGAVDLIKNMGVERRLLIAGEHKGLLDPFLPVNKKQSEHIQILLNEVHQHFIDAVKAGRGDRLSDHDDLFTGLVWSGEKAVKLGLADHFGNTVSVARDHFDAKKVKDFTVKELWTDRLANSLGASIWGSLLSSVGVGNEIRLY